MARDGANIEAAWAWRQEADDTPDGVEARIRRLALEHLEGRLASAQGDIDAAQASFDYFDKFGPDAPATLAETIPGQLEAAHRQLAAAHNRYDAELMLYQDTLDGRASQADIDQFAQDRLAELEAAELAEAS